MCGDIPRSIVISALVGMVAAVIYTHVAAGLSGAALAAVLAWQTQAWRYDAQIATLRTSYAQAQADAKAQALDAEQAIARQQQALHARIDDLDKEARHAQNQSAADRAAAATAAERLRIALNTIRHSGGDAPDPAAAAACERRAGRLADLLAEADGLAGESSAAADGSITRGRACQAIYGQAMEAVKLHRLPAP